MEKVVLTTYRKLYKMCCRVDASIAMRTQLVCCPLQVYDHRLMEWQSFDLAIMEWAESRSYLDGLIRRLNNGSPQYIPPLPEEAARAIDEYKAQCAVMLAEEAAAKRDATATASASASASSSSAESTASGARAGPVIPLNVLPYSKLTVALRRIYEETPFSMNNVANGFAAVKELQYVCDLDAAGRASLVTLAPAAAEGAAPFSSQSDIPSLQRAVTVEPLHNSLMNSLSAEQRVSLDRQSRAGRDAARKGANKPPASMAAATAAAAAGIAPAGRSPPSNAFDEAPELGEEAEEEADLSDSVEGDAPFTRPDSVSEKGEAAQTGEEISRGLPSAAELMEEPKQVQLLLSHPTSRGFFRRTVLLMVRHVTHESAAFVLNKPLRNDEGVEMTIEATVRLGRVHPIFRRHLTQHTLMIGGPVMSGSSFDESIFLLHRVPGIPNALPLGSGLWMDGDLDALLARLDAKEASAEADIIVLCGFAGWGFDQLKGELGNGYWVVASGASENPAVGSFVMSLAQAAAGQQQQQQQQQQASPSPAVESATATEASGAASVEAPADAAATEEERIRAEAQRAADAAASQAIPALKRRRRRPGNARVGGSSSRIETLSWVRAYASLGKPYSEMAMNQKAYVKDEDTHE